MLCEHCKKNLAEFAVEIDTGGQKRMVHLCSHCGRKLYSQYVSGPEATEYYNNYMNNYTNEQAIKSIFNSSEIKRKRELSALEERMKSAILHEKYEEAAHLRDSILRLKCNAATTQQSE